ncbi:MAG TPA: diaminopimelate decarboxylase [Acidimicrobiia bacterium]|nr:diaminopimelate decarboxylase [Acidimicrobiia bacterium]
MITAEPFDTTLVPPALLDADLDALADEYGTPLFVYDEDELRARCHEYVAHFGPGSVAYAGKAFLCEAMVRLVDEEQLHLDVATGGELFVALHAGFPAARIVFHGNNKSDDELRAALDAGVGRIVTDSHDELDRIEALVAGTNVRPTLLVRVTPGVEAHTHEFIETGTEDSKFGFTVADGVARAAAIRVARSDALQLGGLHCHIGSQIYVLESYARALAIVTELAGEVEQETGRPIQEINLGGGLGTRYLADDPPCEIADYAKLLQRALEDGARAAALSASPRLLVEPGRSIAARAAITVYRVGTVKRIPGVGTYVAVDGGMSDNPRPVLYGAGYEAYLPARLREPRPMQATVVGKHCEQGDVLVAHAQLPEGVAVGDLLAVPVTGAYGYSMASNYNKVPRPAVVFVRGGNARVVLRRETQEDLVRLDLPSGAD